MGPQCFPGVGMKSAAIQHIGMRNFTVQNVNSFTNSIGYTFGLTTQGSKHWRLKQAPVPLKNRNTSARKCRCRAAISAPSNKGPRGRFDLRSRGNIPSPSGRDVLQCQELLHQGKPRECLMLLRQLNERQKGQYALHIGDALRLMPYIANCCKPAAAMDLLQQLPPEPRVYHSLICAYGKKKHIQAIKEAAQALLADQRITHPQAEVGGYTLLNVVKAYGMAGKPDLSYSTFCSAEQGGYAALQDVDLCNTLLNAYENDSVAAMDRYAELVGRGFVGDLVTVNTLLKCCMRCRDGATAEVLMEMMKEGGMQGDEYTWNTLVKVYSYSDNLSGLQRLCDDVIRGDLEVSPVVWGSLITAFGRAGYLETAFTLWHAMKERGIPRSADQYGAVIHVAVEGVQAERAIALFDDMKAEGVKANTVTYNIAMKACGAGCVGKKLHAADLDRAFGLLDRMRQEGVPPNHITYTTIMTLCSKAGDGHRAWELYNDIVEQQKLKVDVELCTACMSALGRSGMVDQALQIFKRMVWGSARLRPTKVTFLTLIRLCVDNGALDDALRVYQGMRKAGFPPENREFQLLMAAAAEATLDHNAQTPFVLCGTFLAGDVLDLHGMSVMEARAAVLCVFRAMQVHYRLLQHELHVPLDIRPESQNHTSHDVSLQQPHESSPRDAVSQQHDSKSSPRDAVSQRHDITSTASPHPSALHDDPPTPSSLQRQTAKPTSTSDQPAITSSSHPGIAVNHADDISGNAHPDDDLELPAASSRAPGDASNRLPEGMGMLSSPEAYSGSDAGGRSWGSPRGRDSADGNGVRSSSYGDVYERRNEEEEDRVPLRGAVGLVRPEYINPGRIKVSKEALESWLASKSRESKRSMSMTAVNEHDDEYS